VVPRVLVVQRELEIDGVEQAVVPDGEAALALLAREPFDAVFVDTALPAVDGWLLLAALGSRPERPRLIATVGDDAERRRARRLGADEYVADASALRFGY
jgi:CheY-like chemotaxis protein